VWVFSIGCGFFLGHTVSANLSPILIWPSVVMIGVAAAAWGFRQRWAILVGIALIGAALGFWREATVIHDSHDLMGYTIQGRATVIYVKTFSQYSSSLLRLEDVQLGGQHRTCDCTVWYRIRRRQTVHPGDMVAISGEIVPQPQTQRRSAVQYELLGQIRSLAPDPRTGHAQKTNSSIWSSVGGLNATDAAFLQSLVFGDDSDLNKDLKNEFLDAGLLHVLVASGANLLVLEQFVQVILFPVWRALRLPSWLWAMLQIGLAWAYAGVCSFDVSIVRAAIMTTHRWAAYAAGRRTSPSAGLLWAAVVLATVNPASAFGVSACLSFVATAAVNQVLFSPGVRARRSQYRYRGVRGVLTAAWQHVTTVAMSTLRVELWLLPVLICTFQQCTPYSIVANMLADPMLALLLPLAVLLWLTQSILLNLPCLHVVRKGFAAVLHLGITSLLGVVETVSHLPGALVSVKPSWWFWVLYGAILYILYRSVIRRFFTRIRRFARMSTNGGGKVVL
jgi:ComEC/Rec2-related protein